MTRPFEELVEQARRGTPASGSTPRAECLDAARAYAAQQRQAIRERHRAGESGLNVVRMLTAAADRLLRGVVDLAAGSLGGRDALLRRISLCALGGYGRSELSPFSDLDVCLLYEHTLDADLQALNDFLVPFLWDLGLEVCYSIRSVSQTVELASQDLRAFTCALESRLILGDSTTYARLKLHLRELLAHDAISAAYIESRVRSRYDGIPEGHEDLYAIEPDVKENKGGLRDCHTALWLLMMTYGPVTVDDVVALGIITPDEHLALVQALNVIWRIRNELHFAAGRGEDRLTFANQKHAAKALGYGAGDVQDVARFMQDYYAAARELRRFLRIATQVCYGRHPHGATTEDTLDAAGRQALVVRDGQLAAAHDDAHWFAEQPSRLMEVFWECARRRAPLSRPLEQAVVSNLHLVTDTFRSNDLARRFFLAICNRPLQAGFALRQAYHAGLLARYLPEFAAIQGVIRYEDFHHFPVDEHTLRALEALAALPGMDGPVAGCLNKAFEHLPDPYILVLAILCHDLGKASGEVHVQEGVTLAKQVCNRIGMHEEDTERVAFLVEHHLVMTGLSQYRDIDDREVVEGFAKAMKTEERLRALLLLSYADMAAVGPGVWNDWKGALLMRLYLKAEKILLGRAEVAGEQFWLSDRAAEVRALAPRELEHEVEPHLRGLGERYFSAFSPDCIAAHIGLVAQARERQLAVRCTSIKQTGVSEVVVCTQDRQGLFAQIAGSFTSQLIDVSNAALFTRPDGCVVDCFTVSDASRGRPLTQAQCRAFERVLRRVLINGEDVQGHVDRSRRRLFALLQPRIPVYTRITFDNESSRTHTVIDIETGDRTGLLYDITRAMSDAGLDIAAARIVTDVRRVRDSFYVTMGQGKIDSEKTQETIRQIVHNGIHPRTLAETKGGVT